jgi:acyl carrier protein
MGEDVPLESNARGETVNEEERARLRSICAEACDVDPSELTAETDFYDDLNLDRSELRDVLIAIETAFDISLGGTLGRVQTYDQLEAVVEDALTA